MGYGAFYVICPRASSQYVMPLRAFCHLWLVSNAKSYQAFKAKSKDLDCKAKDLMQQGQGQSFWP